MNAIPLIFMVLAVVVLYFFTSRSQKKQEKEQNDMRNNLQVGDEITKINGVSISSWDDLSFELDNSNPF